MLKSIEMLEHRTVELFRTFYGEKIIYISLDEDEVRNEISESIWHELNPGFEYSYDSIIKKLTLVSATVENWGNEKQPNLHVHWECPKCSEVHHTDIEESDTSPQAWYCEMGSKDDIFLVQW